MSSDTATIKKIQQKVGVTADGIIGPKTLAAISAALGIPAAQDAPQWPTQAQVRKGASIFGKPGNESALVNIVPAYPLYYECNAPPGLRNFAGLLRKQSHRGGRGRAVALQ